MLALSSTKSRGAKHIRKNHNPQNAQQINEDDYAYSIRSKHDLIPTECPRWSPHIQHGSSILSPQDDKRKGVFYKLLNLCGTHDGIDPYVKVSLDAEIFFRTKTIKHADTDSEVLWTEEDNNTYEFVDDSLSSKTLHFCLQDDDVGHDRIIGELSITLNTIPDTYDDDVVYYSTIALYNKRHHCFGGKLVISVNPTFHTLPDGHKELIKLRITIIKAYHLFEEPRLHVESDPYIFLFSISMVLFYFFFGAFVFHLLEGWAFGDALWFFIVTTCTVGYGNFYPTTHAGKLVNCAFILISTCLIGFIFTIGLEYMVAVQSMQKTSQEEEELEEEDMSPADAQKRELLRFACFLFVWVLLGAVIFSFVEDWHFIDSLEFSLVTMATIGYGNLTPKSDPGKVFCCFFMIGGVTLLARVAGLLFERMVLLRRLELTAKIIKHALTDSSQIVDFDQDGDGQIDRFEYLTKVLLMTEEVTPFTIKRIMERFYKLDQDQSGQIEVAELMEQFSLDPL